jgi:hypothetical protein
VSGLAKERIMITSRVMIEKYDKDMNLQEVHESKKPNVDGFKGKSSTDSGNVSGDGEKK